MPSANKPIARCRLLGNCCNAGFCAVCGALPLLPAFQMRPGMTSFASTLGITDRIVEIENAESETLEALYNRAVALLYPSTFEGFGWPIIEAQACGCPVICTGSGPMPEAAGEAGLFHNAEDEQG